MKDAFERRLDRLEATIRQPLVTESWLTDAGMSVNRRTGETITAAELAARPIGPDVLRVERRIVDPEQECA